MTTNYSTGSIIKEVNGRVSLYLGKCWLWDIKGTIRGHMWGEHYIDIHNINDINIQRDKFYILMKVLLDFGRYDTNIRKASYIEGMGFSCHKFKRRAVKVDERYKGRIDGLDLVINGELVHSYIIDTEKVK